MPPIRALSIVARAVSPTRAATSTRFAAATILHTIADTEAHQSEPVWHRPNCRRVTIANPAATMRVSPSLRLARMLSDVDRHPLFRARKYHCCRGLQLDRRWHPEGDN